MQSYVVIGGGLAGLTAANALAGANRSVILYEQSAQLGGRAATLQDRGFLPNCGPHALYCGGRARLALPHRVVAQRRGWRYRCARGGREWRARPGAGSRRDGDQSAELDAEGRIARI